MAASVAGPLIIPQGAPLAEGILRKTHEPYSLHALLPDHLPTVVDLQAKALAELGANAFYLVPKTRAQFFGFLNSWPLACVYGMQVNNVHAAQIILRLHVRPHEHARNIAAIGDLHNYALVQGAITSPAHRGRGLLELMLEFINHSVLPSMPADLLLARVVPENVASWRVFLKAGYKIVAAEADPDDERRVFYLGYNFLKKLGETKHVAASDFNTCQDLCRKGWHGVSYDDSAGMLVFQRT